MKVTTYHDASHFLHDAEDWLEERASVNNMILGLARKLATAQSPATPPPVMMTVAGLAGLEAAALMTPPRGPVLYAPGEDPAKALEALVDALHTGGHVVLECHGPNVASATFADLWCRRARLEPALDMALRIYELRRVFLPNVPGAARQAEPKDLDLLAKWTGEFCLEVGDRGDPAATRASVEALILAGHKMVWEDRGQIVSMAAAQRPLRRGIAISRVYTPPEHRGHGYASACVAALSQQQLDAGKEFCCLYTDLANPTSNKIYQKIGYVPMADAAQFRFAPAERTHTAVVPQLPADAGFRFRKIGPDMRDAFIDYAKEFGAIGEHYRQGDLKAAVADWDAYIQERLDSSAGRNLPWNAVPQTDYLLMRGKRILATGRFRQRLNSFLTFVGGHIGYEVRPSERGKGYATKVLQLCLELARRAGLKRALLTCAKKNVASARVIVKCGGVLENEVTSPRDGQPALRFWIDCCPGKTETNQ